MSTIADLIVKLGFDGKEFGKGLDESTSKLEKTSKKVGSIGKGMTAGVTVPAVAIGAALLKVGSDADSMADTIAASTGATGDELNGLVDSATNVFKSIPTTMETASTALAQVNVATGQTGKGLEDLTASEIRLAEVTGTDLNTTIESTTGIFKNWNVAAEDQTGVLDDLLIASQETGVPIEKLSNTVQKFGPTLRQMGLGLDESIAFVASLGKAGLDTNKTMSAITKTMGDFAKAGKDPQVEMSKLLASIAQAPDQMTATQIAVDALGSKAGPGLAEALFNGTLSVEELTNTLQTSDQTVLSMAGSTDDAAQQFQVLKNQVIAAAIPLGTMLFQALNDLMPTFAMLIGWLAKGIAFFTNLPAPVQKVIFIIGAIAAVIGPVLMAVAPLIPLFSALAGILPIVGVALGLLLSPIGLIVIAVVALFLAWKTNLFGIRDITSEIIDTVIGTFSRLVGWFTGGGLQGIADSFVGVIQTIWDFLISFIIWYVTLPIQVAEVLIEIVTAAADFAEDFISEFTSLPKSIIDTFGGLYDIFLGVGGDIIQGLIDGVTGLLASLEDKIGKVIDVIGRIPGLGHSPWPMMIDAGKDAMDGLIIGMDDRLANLDKQVNATVTTTAKAGAPIMATAGVGQTPTGAMGAAPVINVEINSNQNPQEIADLVTARVTRALLRIQAAGVA